MLINKKSGIVSVVVVLVIGAILLGVITTALTTSIRARTGIMDEKQAYQALLAAESAINSFQQRVNSLETKDHYSGALDVDEINTWLSSTVDASGEALNRRSFDGVAEVLISAVASDEASASFSLQAQSTLIGNNGSKKVLVDMSFDRLGISPRVYAGLTSFVPIDINGNAAVGGQDGSTLSGIHANVAQTASKAKVSTNSKRSFNLKVDDASYIKLNQYLIIDGFTYKVTAKSGVALSLRAIGDVTEQRQIDIGVNVDLVMSALSEPLPSSVSNTAHLSEPSMFLANDIIFIEGFSAKINSLDYQTGIATVSWLGSAPTVFTPLAEGTAVRRNVFGAVSAASISTGNDNKVRVFNGSSAYDSERVPNPGNFDNPLFVQTFGASQTEVLASATHITFPTNPIEGLTFLDGDWDSNTIPLCGDGILIVSGNMNLNDTCPSGFHGLLYIMGEFDFQGNAEVQGAVVVEGTTRTRISGTATDLKITYDPVALFKAGQLYTPYGLSMKKQTWRQR